MRQIELIRVRRDGKAVHGTIRAPRWAWDCNQFPSLENADYIIPTGTYEVRLTYSPRFKKYLPLLMNVPGRTGIRIHTGSKPEHSKQCQIIYHHQGCHRGQERSPLATRGSAACAANAEALFACSCSRQSASSVRSR